ncbi:hypothetical protein BaRGS_00011459 [Batillaria attramentaria]|uniref:Uncharacterized protein n=1 Tax=Batillaria attramentaria TaxID=370345 RepID=A0ABD0LCP9_9CAEN
MVTGLARMRPPPGTYSPSVLMAPLDADHQDLLCLTQRVHFPFHTQREGRLVNLGTADAAVSFLHMITVGELV